MEKAKKSGVERFVIPSFIRVSESNSEIITKENTITDSMSFQTKEV